MEREEICKRLGDLEKSLTDIYNTLYEIKKLMDKTRECFDLYHRELAEVIDEE